MELNPTQIIILGIIVAILAQGIKLLAAKLGKPIDRKVITVFLFILSIGLAYLWTSPTLPQLPILSGELMVVAMNILTFVMELISVASVVVGFATMIYNWLLQKLFDAIGIGKERILSLQYPVK